MRVSLLRQQRLGNIDKKKSLENKIQLLSETIDLEKSLLDRYSELYRDEAASYIEVTAQKRTYYNSVQQLRDTETILAELTNKNKELELEIQKLEHDQRKRVIENKQELLKLGQRITEVEALQSMVLKSPVDGIVTSKRFNVGNTIKTEQDLLTILPNDSTLVAELYVPSRAIGFVKKGQRVMIEFDTYPSAKYGFFFGVVDSITGSLVDNIQSTENTQSYLVRVKLEESNIIHKGEILVLTPGMNVSSNIILEKQKIWQWFFSSSQTA